MSSRHQYPSARACFGLGGVYEPDEAKRVSSALLSEANRMSHTARASSTGPISRTMGRPLSTDQLKGWVPQSGQSVG